MSCKYQRYTNSIRYISYKCQRVKILIEILHYYIIEIRSLTEIHHDVAIEICHKNLLKIFSLTKISPANVSYIRSLIEVRSRLSKGLGAIAKDIWRWVRPILKFNGRFSKILEFEEPPKSYLYYLIVKQLSQNSQKSEAILIPAPLLSKARILMSFFRPKV